MNKIITAIFAVLIALAFVGTTLAKDPHLSEPPIAGPDNPGGGRPEADCGAESDAPGNENSFLTSPGSPFGQNAENVDFGAVLHYALEDGSNDNPAFYNSQAPFYPNSQYDVACLQVSENHGHP